MTRTRVKVCGMRDPVQVQQLVNLGVDAIGLIFYEPSPRNVTIEEAKLIRQIVPAFVSLVGVFVDSTVEQINTYSEQIQLDIIQLHGDQDKSFAKNIQRPYIKVVRVSDAKVIEYEREQHIQAQSLLLDTFSKSEYGGTGHRIPTEFLPQPLPKGTILAGGITPENTNAVLNLHPFAIDINSGVEHSPANKNVSMVEDIMQKVRKFDQECH